ncbi:MAG: hypothetical protein JWN44_5744 [Myxococcales bacterium]|nr:hypothetical protein [Myxococcales bacterium]
MRQAVLLVVLVLDLALTWNVPAQARAQSDLPYAVGEAFSTAVRFVRIDRGCKVVDKDADAAFVSFECSDEGNKVRRGSLELFKVAGGVRTQVTLGDETHGMELRWLELFERKLREERGTPVPTTPAAPPAKPAKDGGV